MKCEYCGANMGLEDKYCPYCGKINPYAKQHQEQMQQYQQKFEETRQDVEAKANRFAGIAAPMTVLAISAVIFLASIILAFNADEIARSSRVRELEAQEPELRARIELLLNDQDYLALNEMYNDENLYMISGSYRSEALSDYDMIFRAASAYASLFEQLGNRTESSKYRFEPDHIEVYTSMIASSLVSLYTLEEKDYFEASCYTKDKLAPVHDMQDQISALLIAYADFTPEEIRQIPDMSETLIQDLLTERLAISK